MSRPHDQDPEEERDPHLDAVMLSITENYQPAESADDADLKLTTEEVYELVRQHYPAPTYSSTDVYQILEELGYKARDVYGDMRLLWLLRRLS